MELKEAPLELSSESLFLCIFVHNLLHLILWILFTELSLQVYGCLTEA